MREFDKNILYLFLSDSEKSFFTEWYFINFLDKENVIKATWYPNWYANIGPRHKFSPKEILINLSDYEAMVRESKIYKIINDDIEIK